MPSAPAAPPAKIPPPQAAPAKTGPAAAPPPKAQELTPQKMADEMVTPSDMDGRKGLGKMFEKLEKRSKAPGSQETVPTKVPEVTPASDDEIGEDALETIEPLTETTPEGEAAPEEKEGETKPESGEKPKSGKVNPWKLVDEWKSKAANLEKQMADLKTIIPDEAARRQEIARLEHAEARAKELEEHIKFVDYSKSDEFRKSYQEPYEKAWQKAMSEMKELTVQDVFTGQERGVSPQDILDLVNLPLPKAREAAEQMFGSFSNDVMTHRAKIKELYEKQAEALEQKKTEATTVAAQKAEDRARMIQAHKSFIDKNWESANKSITANPVHGPNFTPVEGDEAINQRLAKGYELVDRAFSENPMDPRLSPDQRIKIVKRHAAMRHRAAAYGRLVVERDRARSELKKAQGALAKIKGGSPDMVTSGSGQTSTSKATPGSAHQRLDQKLNSLAH